MRIIFENQDKSIGILIPTQECVDLFGIEAIAKKDVPEGLPYWIVEDVHIPESRTFRNAWETDESMESLTVTDIKTILLRRFWKMLKINIEKAKEIKKDMLRVERKPLLEALDVAAMMNITDSVKLAEIEAEKQKLRDITTKVDELTTVEELKEATIESLIID